MTGAAARASATALGEFADDEAAGAACPGFVIGAAVFAGEAA
jgi:hypothetical protein